MNSYQLSKARKISASLLASREQLGLTNHKLAQLVALADADTWRKLSFAAGVAVADLACKAAVIGMLRKRGIHAA